MLLAAFLAGLTLALAADDVITKPSPGNEYVSLATGAHNGHRAHHEMKVYVKDEGTTGIKRSEKHHPTKKVEPTANKKDSVYFKAAVKDEGAVGAQRKESSGVGVPPHKHISFPSQAAKSHREKFEESPDFDDDSPIVAAASSQSSRINVKKGPNGQEYEYEYVYYYYDDEEEGGDGKKAAGEKSAAGGVAKTTEKAAAVPELAEKEVEDVVDLEEEPRPADEGRQELRQEGGRQEVGRQDLRQEVGRQDLRQEVGRQDLRHEGARHETRQELRTQELRQDERQSLRDEPQRHRGSSEPRYQKEQEEEDEVPAVRQRGGDRFDEGRSRQKSEGRQESRHRGESRTEETKRGRPVPAEDSASRTRYTTIERGRVKAADAATTAEPSSNEVLPTRGPSRSRGQPVDVIEDDRLPSNARFPSRSRGSAAEPSRNLEQAPPTRSRGSSQGERGGTLRRPSLVDSSSFRTHGADGAPDEDKPGYLSSQLDTRESDFEEYVRPTTFQPPTTLPPPALSTEPQEMPQKAAIDLYAILQQTQEENSVLEPEVRTTDIPTTEPPTTTTTTEPTTTTTTTTTTTPPPTQPTQRGRFRNGNSRTRLRSQVSSTTTTETPEEEPPKREKFKPSHNRNPGQVSAYGRRRAGATTAAPTTETTQSSSRARPSNFASANGGSRYRTRGRVSTTEAPQEEESEEPSSTTARPPRARISATPDARPLRPGPRLNLRPRPLGAPTSTAAPAEQPAPKTEETPVTTPPEPAAHAEDSLTRLRTRPRLKVQQPAVQPRPFSATNRRPLPGLRRRTTESEAEVEATTPGAQVGETEPSSAPSSTEPPQPQTTESKLSSLISRRRPIARRVQHQPPAEN